MRLLRSDDGAATFQSIFCDNWMKQRTPRTSAVMRRGPNKLYAAWDSLDTVWWSPMMDQRNALPQKPRGGKSVWRGNVDLCVTQSGAVFLTWVEGPTGREPTQLAWQVFDNASRTGVEVGHGPDAISGSCATPFVRKDDLGVTVIY